MKSWNNARIFPHQAGPSWRGSIYSQILLWCLRHSPSRGWNSNHRRWEPQTHFLRRPSTQWPEWNNSEPSHTDRTQSNRSPRTSPPFAASCCRLNEQRKKMCGKSYGESGACISERLQVNNEMRLNSDVGLLLFWNLPSAVHSLKLVKLHGLTSSAVFHYLRVFPC